MRVFLSWSGDKSRAVAQLLNTWIKGVIQATQPFISTDDVEKGSVWFSEIGDTLAGTNIGVICLTQSNKANPWILFEAGALSKGLSNSRVWTLLIDLDFRDLEPPLSQFNGTKPVKEDIHKLIESINKAFGDAKLADEVLRESFELWWPRFENSFRKILQEVQGEAESEGERSVEDMVAELLQLTRSVHSSVSTLNRRSRPGSPLHQYPQFGTLLSELISPEAKPSVQGEFTGEISDP